MQELELLVKKLEVQNEKKFDFVLPSKDIIFLNNTNIHCSNKEFETNEVFESQLINKLNIPTNYYNRMKDNLPDLMAKNINEWLLFNETKNVLIRSFIDEVENKNTARAFLSDRYNILDNYDVLFKALEAIQKTGVNVKITKAEVSDRKMYLHVTCPEVEINAESFLNDYLKENNSVGNGIISGFVLSNSEVGLGAFEIKPRAVIVKCNNGLILKDQSLKRYHLGAKMDQGAIRWSSETLDKNMQLIMSQTKDAVNTFLSKKYLGIMIEKIAELEKISFRYPVEVTKNVTSILKLNEESKNNILRYFIQDGKTNGTGLMNAITREAQNLPIDKQNDVEENVFTVLNPKTIINLDKPEINKN